MANIKISDLTAAAAATGTQQFEVNDSLTSKKVTGAQVLAYVESNLTIQNNAVTTAKIVDKNVTLAKLPDQSTSTILGRTTAGSGSPEVLTGAQARTIVGADNASNLTSGTVGTARLASGTANSTTYLRGDQTWATVSGFSGPRATVYTSNSTFTIPSGITAVKVTVIGGGSGGSGSGASGGANGNGGGTAIKWLTGLTSGNTLSVTIGAGGSGGGGSTHGAAGGASTVASGTQSITTITGGGGSASNTPTGGTATNGDLNIPGGSGNQGINGGITGNSLYGNGVRSTASTAGTGYGTGGGKGNDSDCTQRGGGAGTAGVVVFEY